MQLGIDRLIQDAKLRKALKGKRLALAAHPASVTSQLKHSLDALMACKDLNISSAFGPQHGMRGEKQDNMIESDNYVDPFHNIPVFSLYGEVRRPTDDMLDTFDVLLFDIQDLGCRIYTYITTLLYLLEACARKKKSLWVLDRPNPAGRPIEGTILEDGWQSFVGAGQIIMRHGLTVGEMAEWFVKYHNIDVDLSIVKMQDYDPNAAPGYGWPTGQLSWVNPSPNASSLNMARCYAGTVILEGTTLSEGRGTTVPLEIMGAPGIDTQSLLIKMEQIAKPWMQGAHLRSCYFEPTFHKHVHTLCEGIQVHTDNPAYDHHAFKPYRLTILFLKAVMQLYPEYEMWSHHDYEYELTKLPFDVINGGTFIREWIEDSEAVALDFEKVLTEHESQWQQSVEGLLIYK
ncbi:exo-beta-N-acetylmuramidase NamZ family protein [Kaarinaea lacus]